MRKFTLFMMSLFLMLGTAMAQSYSLTETRLNSEELNAKTAPTLIAIKNLSATNNYYFVGNTGAIPYSAAEFSDAAVFIWQPVEEGVAGSYYLMKPDGTYMQASSPKDFGTIDGAAVFTTTNPTTAGAQNTSVHFNGDDDSQAYIDDQALLVRFVNAAGTWINVHNGDGGTPTYNSGLGGWTIHYIYAVEEPAAEYDNIADIAEDVESTIKGTVIATYSKGFLVQDETGMVLVYLNAAHEYVAGDVVTVNGVVTTYGGLLQFPKTSVVEKTGESATVEYPTATVMDGAALDAFLTAPVIQYVEYTGTLTINGSYYNVAVEGATTAMGSIQYPNTGLVTASTGDVVKVTGYTIGVSSNKYVNTMAVAVEVVEEAPDVEIPEYNVTEALAAYVEGSPAQVTVTGYIVGSVDINVTNAAFGADATTKTNMLISDNPYTTDVTECLVIQLPSGDLRNKLNIVDNPANYRAEVVITGSLEKYCGAAGVKNLTHGELTGNVAPEPEPETPFEVVAVTPSEPVAELSTITVEFSEEIAGEQDIMDTMNYIYVGSRTNACNFTVDGKVLTITLWTPITAAGEYALYVPAGVGITRASNGEAVVIDGEITFTIEEAVVEPEPEETFPRLSTDAKRYYYRIASYNRGGYLTSVGDGIEHVAESMASYWYFTKANENGGIYFHNYTTEQTLGADKTMSDTPGVWYVLPNGVNEEGLSISSTNPISDMSCIDANNYNTGVGAWHPTATDWHGTTWVFAEVDVDAMVAELQAARDAFNAAYAEAQAIVEEANFQATFEAITLQTTDETAAGYIYSNAPDTSEGSIHHLVDGIVGDAQNYFHSNWQNNGASSDGLDHYLLVDLGEGASIADFNFNYHTRTGAANDYPVDILIEGSKDGETFTEIGKVSGIAARGNESFTSPMFTAEEGCRYVRFMVTKTSTDRVGSGCEHNYFHMAEFGISNATATVAEKYAEVASAVSVLKYIAEAHANNAEYDKDELIAATEAIADALFDIYKDDNTIALIESAYELLAIEGVGYPAVAPREALEEAIEIAEEMPDTEAGTALQAAIDAYYATTDVVLPEGGKVYSLTMVAKNGNKFYLNYTGSDIAMVARTTDEELPNSAKFAAEDNGDGTISLKTIDGKYLVYHSKYAGLNWLQGGGDTDGLQETKDDMTNITFAKMVNGNKVEATDDEQIFGMLTWYGKRGYDTGKSEDCYGYMVLKTDGSDYDGASVPFWNDSYSSAFIVEETEYIAEPLNVVAVTPAENEVVNSLREITIEFDAEIAVKELNGTERISIDYGWGVFIGTTATVEGKLLKLVADTEITDNGTYPLTIPAGVVTRVSDGVAYEGGTFTFTVEKAAVVVEPLTVVAVTPAEAVETLETITIEFSDNVDVPATASGKFTIADADGNNVATLNAWDAAVDGKIVTLTLTEAITTAGEYTFSFAEGLVTRQGDGATCAYTCTITVTGVVGIDSIYGEAGDSVIYDITGRKIEKITEGGIYIVNGKKVLVK